MLRNGTDLLTSLSVLERQDFSPGIRRMTSEMVQQAANDVPVDALFLGRDEFFPPVFVFALRSGQGPERVGETLRDLADCLWQAADLGLTLTMAPGDGSDEAGPPLPDHGPVVRMVDSILGRALKVGATEIDIRPAEGKGLAEITYNINGKWEPMAELPIDLLGPLTRRICIMAKINWWFHEPALGTLTIEHAGETVRASVRYVPGTREDDQEVCVAFADAPEEAEPS